MNVCGKCGCDIWPDDGCSCPGGYPSWRERKAAPPIITTVSEAVEVIETLLRVAAADDWSRWQHSPEVREARAFVKRAKEGP